MAKRRESKKQVAPRKKVARKKAEGTASVSPPGPQASRPPTAHVCFPFLDRDLALEFVGAVERLEQSLELPVWLIVQDGAGQSQWDVMSSEVRKYLFACRKAGLDRNQKVAVLIDSRGGSARCAFEIARLFQRHCGGFVAVIPRRAKSAATLLCLGADEIILGEYGELGPLDVQVEDPEREERFSGLDEVQSLERLNAFALTAFDQAMFLLIKRTGMKVTTLLPHVTRLVTAMTEPLFTGVDVVRYTQMSRSLKVGEEYARRLLMHRYTEERANAIARSLVENYPGHSFIIDQEEAARVGLQLKKPTDGQIRIMDDVSENLPGLTAIGRVIQRQTL